MGKQEILDQLQELLNVPQIERILHHKVEELKLNLSDEISHYREVKEVFKKSAYGVMKVCEWEEEEDKSQVYHFEMNALDSGEWQVTGLEPSPPPGYSFQDIVPEEIVRYVSAFETAPGKVESKRGFRVSGLQGLTFDLMFTKYSNQHILGTIQSTRLPISHEVEEREQETQEEIYDYDSLTFGDESNIHEMVYYLQKYPDLKAYFLTQLHMKMKPLIMKDMVNFTSTSQPVDLF